MVMWLCTQKNQLQLVATGPVSPQNPGNQDQTTKDWLQPSAHIGCLWSSFSWVLGFLIVLGLDFQTLVVFIRKCSSIQQQVSSDTPPRICPYLEIVDWQYFPPLVCTSSASLCFIPSPYAVHILSCVLYQCIRV